MTFLLPSILAGLIGATVPVLIHLRHRRRSRRVRWAAMQFLGPLAGSSTRKGDLKLWLLMACRIAVIAVMALALSRLRVTATVLPSSWLASTPVNIAVIIDHSLSSTRITDGQSAFERSVDMADEVLQKLRSTDSAVVILAEHGPRMLTAGMARGSDALAISNLRRSLRLPRMATTDSSIPFAITAAEKSIASAPPADNIILILSAPHQPSWRPQDTALWNATFPQPRHLTPVYLLSFPASSDFADAAVTNLHVDPEILGKSQALHFRCTITNLGTRPFPPTSSHVLIDEIETDSRPVPALAAKATTDLDFPLPQGIPNTGSHRIRVTIDAHDSLDADNQAFATVEILDPQPVLIVDGSFSAAGNATSSQFLKAALHPSELSILDPTVIPLGSLPTARLADFGAIIFNDCPTLPPSVRDDLISYSRAGHGLWFILGPRTQSDFIQANLINPGLFPCQAQSPRSASGPGITAVVKDSAHTILGPLVSMGGNPFTGSFVRTWYPVTPNDHATRTIIATPSGDPLILDHPASSSGGPILLWTTSADGSWNNWNLMPNFVPLVIESAIHLALPPSTTHPTSLTPGQPIEFSAPADPPFPVATVTAPDGSQLSKAPTAVDNRLLVTFQNTFLPGFYTLTAGTVTRYFAVNPDPRELAPAPLSADDVRWLGKTQKIRTVTAPQLDRLLRPHARQLELSTFLAILVLALLVTESAIALSMTRHASSRPIPNDMASCESEVVGV